MDDSSRNGQVIAAANWYVAEWRLQRSLTFIEIKQVVPVAVRKPVRALRFPWQPKERDDDVLVLEDGRVTLGPLLPEEQAPAERLVLGGPGDPAVERPRRRGPDPKIRHRRTLVVEDRELAVEAPAREALFVAQRAGGRAEHRVRLGWKLPAPHPVDHPTTSRALESDRCAASIDSKSARKLP